MESGGKQTRRTPPRKYSSGLRLLIWYLTKSTRNSLAPNGRKSRVDKMETTSLIQGLADITVIKRTSGVLQWYVSGQYRSILFTSIRGICRESNPAKIEDFNVTVTAYSCNFVRRRVGSISQSDQSLYSHPLGLVISFCRDHSSVVPC